ncbi:MAG: PadR family transcriptional regulator [Candidatus Hydrogenedentes bacterium]|nr:PadR family transcriptional regulator [Candidatus Hydrogenedentota bacterium]
MENIERDLLRGHLEGMVLSLLETGEAHGYEILKRFQSRGAGALTLKEGSLYPALYRLEQDGFIRGKWETASEKRRGPRRRIYSLTDKGRKELARKRNTWQTFAEVVGNIMEATT